MNLIKIKNLTENHLHITYNLTSTCNYKCSYCWPEAHDGKNRFPEYEVIVKNFDHLLNFYKSKIGKTDIKISLAGGEPTFWPMLGEFAQHLHLTHNCRLCLNTNGSRTIRWWKTYARYFDDIQISVHNEFVDTGHIINVLDEIYSHGDIMVAAQVMMDPNNWNKSFENLDILVNHPTEWLVKARVLTDPLNYEILNYTNEQLKILEKNVKKRPPDDYVNLMLSLGRISEDDNTNGTMTFSDGTEYPLNKFEILKNKWNQFSGWSCDIGSERLGIMFDGTIQGNCGVVISDNKLNINSKNFIEQFESSTLYSSVICNRKFCDCQADIRVSKYRV